MTVASSISAKVFNLEQKKEISLFSIEKYLKINVIVFKNIDFWILFFVKKSCKVPRLEQLLTYRKKSYLLL